MTSQCKHAPQRPCPQKGWTLCGERFLQLNEPGHSAFGRRVAELLDEAVLALDRRIGKALERARSEALRQQKISAARRVKQCDP